MDISNLSIRQLARYEFTQEEWDKLSAKDKGRVFAARKKLNK